MNIHVHGEAVNRGIQWFGDGLIQQFLSAGSRLQHVPDGSVDVVINCLDPDKPKYFRRRGQGTFVIGIVSGRKPKEGMLYGAYPYLVRSLSNLLIYLVEPGASEDTPAQWPKEVWFVTPEQGHYGMTYDGGLEDDFFRRVYDGVAPVAQARLVINNIYDDDLETALYGGDAETRALRDAGKKLDRLDLLPAPFPLENFLSPREIAHIQRLYSMGGLSYGNLSVRKDETRFWMSASGVDKSDLKEVGRDILMVKGYDEKANAIRLSVPKNVEPRRVSVDAIEHWMIYTQHPGVGAIIHVHAWIDGIRSTQVNFPCGTYELGEAVARLVAEAPDPNRAVIGLKNHGLTITGTSLDDIFHRIDGRILRQIPMTS